MLNIIFPYLVCILIAISISISLFKTEEDIKKSLSLFFISLLVYSLYTLVRYGIYVESDIEFRTSDEYEFYTVADALGKLPSISDIFEECFISDVHMENNAAYFWRAALAYYANHFMNGNSHLLQYLCTSLIASLSSIFLYNILKNFVSGKQSFKFALVYICCSLLLINAGKITRDSQIDLLYMIGFSIFFSAFSLKKLILLIALVIITTQFRMEHGLFMLFMPLLYIYEQTKGNKIVRYIFIIIGIVLMSFLSVVIIPQIVAIQNTLEGYVEYTQEAAEQSGGLGKYILRLPMGLKQFFTVLYSQMSPFPSWNLVVAARDIPQLIIGLVQMIAPTFWFMVWFSVAKAMCMRNYRKTLPLILVYSGLIFLIFLFANTSNMNPRRLICMYPVFYVFFVIAKERYPLYMKKSIRQGLGAYLILCFIYLMIKL